MARIKATEKGNIPFTVQEEIDADAADAAYRAGASGREKAIKIEALNKAFGAATQEPVIYMGATFQADAISQDTLAKVLSAGSVPAGFAWYDILNKPTVMTYAQLQGLSGTMLSRGFHQFQKLRMLKDAVNAATTVADVKLVAW